MGVPDGLLERYVTVWNEPDASARRDAVARLWTPDGLHSPGPGDFRDSMPWTPG
ncbi:hypothetical protein ACQPYK_04730 [Streptosporangium sp. CA-135522]|uniref:hypothetical protein n=1 Tax=Streptosporangium sp. CA-135522 TaxID=3240072 RepID=UPI003D913714